MPRHQITSIVAEGARQVAGRVLDPAACHVPPRGPSHGRTSPEGAPQVAEFSTGRGLKTPDRKQSSVERETVFCLSRASALLFCFSAIAVFHLFDVCLAVHWLRLRMFSSENRYPPPIRSGAGLSGTCVTAFRTRPPAGRWSRADRRRPHRTPRTLRSPRRWSRRACA